jgi:hypothetical protein
MIELDNVLSNDPKGQPLQIRRVPPNRPTHCVATSTALVVVRTHFWGGRTVPHDNEHCQPCNEGCPTREHAYTAAYCHNTAFHFLLELTYTAARNLQDYVAEHGTLRGCEITAERWHGKANSRIIIECAPYDSRKYQLPEEPDIRLCLARLWQLPEVKLQMKNHDHNGEFQQNRASAIRAALQNQNPPIAHGNGEKK